MKRAIQQQLTCVWSILAWQLGILPFSFSINLCCASSFLSASYTHDQASLFLNNCTCCDISSITSMFFIFSSNSSSSFNVGFNESSIWLTRPFASFSCFAIPFSRSSTCWRSVALKKNCKYGVTCFVITKLVITLNKRTEI